MAQRVENGSKMIFLILLMKKEKLSPSHKRRSATPENPETREPELILWGSLLPLNPMEARASPRFMAS